MCLKNIILLSECSEDTWFEISVYFGDDEVKESIIISYHVSPIRMKSLRPAAGPLKGAGQWRNHVTQIQEITATLMTEQ